MKEKIVFVILHYYTINDTIKCINSIKDNVYSNNYEIVIVENGSPNKTGQELKKLYDKEEKIHILISDKNLGFAKGNNIGFKYAKYDLKADFIVMMNNDTMIIQKNCIEIIVKEYKKSKFAIMGPKILLPGEKIYYFPETLIKKNELVLELLALYKSFISEYIGLATLKRKTKKDDSNDAYDDKKVYKKTKFRKENVVLHGCFWIFSPEYISIFDGIDDRTFLYREEYLLYIRAKRNNLKTVYNPELTIFHNENSATNATQKVLRKKNMLIHKNRIKSTKILLKEIKKEEKNEQKRRISNIDGYV